LVADGQVGRTAFTFLTEIVGLTRREVEALRDAPGGRDGLPVIAATLPREAHALAAADVAGAARQVRQVRQPVLLLVGTARPRWLARSRGSLPPRSPLPIAAAASSSSSTDPSSAMPGTPARLLVTDRRAGKQLRVADFTRDVPGPENARAVLGALAPERLGDPHV